ncbi:MAG: Asp23/Gls24 family envelope stress response protein [Parasporobacterium sp.]|nr:Asp23/Gls24 family envelope stress response protein [Parasporobacterium sp.]
MDTLKIYNSDGSVDVQITEEVIAIIAGLAATEVDGVHSMAGGITNEIVARLGKKNLAAGITVQCSDDTVTANLSLVIKMGYNIPDVSAQVQEKVKTAIENMTGLKVTAVNIRIANVNFDNQ